MLLKVREIIVFFTHILLKNVNRKERDKIVPGTLIDNIYF